MVIQFKLSTMASPDLCMGTVKTQTSHNIFIMLRYVVRISNFKSIIYICKILQDYDFIINLQGATMQTPNFGASGPVMNQTPQPQASGSTGGAAGGNTPAQPKQRVRARRGQATDPHSIAERVNFCFLLILFIFILLINVELNFSV